MVSGLPPTFRRSSPATRSRSAGARFDVLTGDGHAPEQVMLYCAADQLFLAADQVLAKITPNVSVWAVEPDGDPLGLYLRSLARAEGATCRRTCWCCRAISCRSTACTRAATS